MADTVAITDLKNSIDLVYAAGSQEAYSLYYGSRLEVQETSVLLHEPDYGDTRPIRANDEDRTFYFTLDVTQDSVDEDEIGNNIALLKRWVDGADQQALRYQLVGDCDPIYVKVQLNNWTHATLHRIKWGLVDDSGAFYTQYKDMVTGETIAYQVHVMLRLEPYGEAETPMILRNDLNSSPHFIEDGDGNGRADGWSLVNTPTCSLDRVRWVIGGQSQQITTDASTSEGLESSTVSCTDGQTVVGYLWLYLESQCDDITVDIHCAGISNPATKVIAEGDSGAVSDKSFVDSAGNTWYRVSMTATIPPGATTVSLRTYRDTSDATAISTYNIDGAYLNLNTNLIGNAGFETAGTGGGDVFDKWIEFDDFVGTISDETTLVNTGSDACKISKSSVAASAMAVYQDLTVEPDTEYTYSFYTRGDGTHDGMYEIQNITDYPAWAGPDIIAKIYTGVTGTTYTQVTDTFTTPADCSVIRFWLYISDSTDTNVSIYYDDVIVSKGQAVPDGWCSSSVLENHYDPPTLYTYINYIDTWGIPGDAPALATTIIDYTQGTASGERYFYLGRAVDGVIPAAQEKFWLEDDESTGNSASNASWTESGADAARTDGTRDVLTDSGGGAPYGTGAWVYSPTTGNDARRLFAKPKRVYVLGAASSTAITLTMHITNTAATYVFTKGAKTSDDSGGYYHFIDLGLMNLQGSLTMSPPNYVEPASDLSFKIAIVMTADSQTVSIDAVLFMPTEEYMVIDLSGATIIYIRGKYKDVIDYGSGYDTGSWAGSMWNLAAGNIMNRVIIAADKATGSNQAPIIGPVKVSYEIIPRTRHLLGTA